MINQRFPELVAKPIISISATSAAKHGTADTFCTEPPAGAVGYAPCRGEIINIRCQT